MFTCTCPSIVVQCVSVTRPPGRAVVVASLQLVHSRCPFVAGIFVALRPGGHLGWTLHLCLGLFGEPLCLGACVPVLCLYGGEHFVNTRQSEFAVLCCCGPFVRR